MALTGVRCDERASAETGADGGGQWNALQDRKTALQAIGLSGRASVVLHPGMAELCRQKVTNIARALEHPDPRTEAAEAIRGLVDAVVLMPTDGAWTRTWSVAGAGPKVWLRMARPKGRSNRIERESGRHAQCGSKQNEAAGNRRPRIAESDGCGGCNQRYLQLWSGAA